MTKLRRKQKLFNNQLKKNKFELKKYLKLTVMMKKTILLFAFLISVAGAYAQKGKVASAQTLKDTQKLDKALEAINEAIDPTNEKAEKSIPWAKTWEVRGDIYRAIYQSKDENIKKLADDPLQTSLESFKKALELDEKGRNANGVKINLTLLISDFTDQAVNAFNENNYELALKSFESILDIESMPVMQEAGQAAVDTVIIFNAGLAAYNAEKYDDAIQYYKEAAKYDYNGARTYELIASSYTSKQDTASALLTLQEGFEKYPENSSILVLMINIYLNANKVDDAMKYLELAIKQDPENGSFHFAQGSLYDKLGETEKAIKAYEKAIELKEDYFDAYYNLGAIYYNQGVKQVEVANAVPTNQPDKYEEEKNKADEEFKKAIPYMEKASEINAEDTFSLESLKTLYYRLKMMDKFDEVNKKLEDLK
ncbi:tetratricopeptide repeat protein [Gaoshiqia sediminis]|uniref:Tetratricopeptide repeat protein n=1 Tax=Gaoshiqia sediminis TaxID=2986998 RepID=A0AA41YA85_9BACT|nr:tetratricopeptide repeat protein [Gaoshiqia sediminis]MCW0482140.1 tetratricopeptide repeat protein [Gaoshiqia sediminis]